MELEPSRLVILDTDPGIDDAMALLYLAAQSHLKLHSITTVFGNADVATTTRNACYLANRFGIDAPIHAGANEPLRGERLIPQLRVHGQDGLGDIGVAADYSGKPQPLDAARHIITSVRKNPGQISLLAIGPLTNLATALRLDPSIAGLVREVVVMGGAFGTRGRLGNIQPHAEANFFYDPDAADEVLGADWPVTVVGLDVSTDCVLSTSLAEKLARISGGPGRFLWDISRGYADIYRRFDGIDGFCVHDVAAAAYLSNRELFETRNGQIRVEINGQAVGQSVATYGTGRPSQRYCVDVQWQAVIAGFVEAILQYREPDPATSRGALAP